MPEMRTVTLPPLSSWPAVELMRVSVFEAKLLTQTDCPGGRHRGGGGVSGRPGDANRQPDLLPGVHIDPRDRPVVLVGDEERAGGHHQPTRLRAHTDRLAHRPKRARVEPDDLAALAVGEPDASAGDDDPDREPADAARV